MIPQHRDFVTEPPEGDAGCILRATPGAQRDPHPTQEAQRLVGHPRGLDVDRPTLTPYYEDESVTLYHGDCREVLPLLGPIDAAVTDPPYGVGLEYSDQFADTPEYVESLVAEALPLIRSTCKVVAVTPGTVNIWRYPPTPSVLVWVQTNNLARSVNPKVRLSGAQRAWQPILVYGDRFAILRGDVYGSPTVSDRSVNHPCPKPREFARWLIGRITDPGQTLLDPFAGSGVFLRAAVDMGRKAVGIEIEERHCEEIANRMSQGILDFGEASA